MEHIPPEFRGYEKGTWTIVLVCKGCGSIGHPEDFYFKDTPCEFCERIGKREAVGKWVGNKWILQDEEKDS